MKNTIKTNKYCSGAILGQENPLGDFGHFNLGIMGYNDWNNNWGNSWNNWGNGKGKGRGKNWFQNQGFNNYNRAAPYYGGAQSVTSQLGITFGEMASLAEACYVGQSLNQSNMLSPGAFETGRIHLQFWYHDQAAVNIIAQTTATTASYTFGTLFGYSIGNGLS